MRVVPEHRQRPASPALEIEAWWVDIEACADALLARDAQAPVVAEEDRARALRLDDAGHRRERLAAHVALRLVLARHGADDASARPFERQASGKPVLSRHWRTDESLAPDGLDFSLSHIEGVALIAVSRGAGVGIDVERLRPVAIDAPRRALIEGAAAALRMSAPLPREGDPRRLQQAWTRLEALAKARGVGMARVLSEIGAVGGRRYRASEQAAAGGHLAATDGRAAPEPDLHDGGERTVSIAAADLFCVRDLDLADRALVASVARAGTLPDGLEIRPFPRDADLARAGS